MNPHLVRALPGGDRFWLSGTRDGVSSGLQAINESHHSQHHVSGHLSMGAWTPCNVKCTPSILECTVAPAALTKHSTGPLNCVLPWESGTCTGSQLMCT